MSRPPLLSLPLLSRAIPLGVAFAVLGGAASAVAARGMTLGHVLLERYAEPVVEPARVVAIPGGRPLRVPGRRHYGTLRYEWASLVGGHFSRGEIEGLYTHAGSTKEGDTCAIVLGDPRPDPARRLPASEASRPLPLPVEAPAREPMSIQESARRLVEARTRLETIMAELDATQDLDPGESPPAPTQTITFPRCSARLEADVVTAAARLDAWLSSPSSPSAFEATMGSRSIEIAYVSLVLATGALVLLALLRLRLELVELDAVASHRMIRIVRRLGPFRRPLAEVLASEIAGARVLATGHGPLTFYRPALVLGNKRRIDLWPLGRLGSKRAAAARDAIVAALDASRAEAPPGETSGPFRGAG